MIGRDQIALVGLADHGLQRLHPALVVPGRHLTGRSHHHVSSLFKLRGQGWQSRPSESYDVDLPLIGMSSSHVSKSGALLRVLEPDGSSMGDQPLVNRASPVRRGTRCN